MESENSSKLGKKSSERQHLRNLSRKGRNQQKSWGIQSQALGGDPGKGSATEPRDENFKGAENN